MTDIIQLAAFRPLPQPPSPVGCAADWHLIDELCRDLMLVENVQIQVRAALAGILVEALSNVEAVVAWRTIEAEIKRPLPPRSPGEAPYQPMLDRLRAVDVLATNFWTYHSQGARCPSYQQRKGS